MAGGYSVTISAKDAASSTIDGVNKRWAAMQKRIEAAQAPLKEVGNQFSQFAKVTGVDKIATGFKSFGIAAGEAWRSISRVVEPLAAITGAASLAGILRLSQAWADFGSALGNQANRAGASADQLYNLQNAARLAGVDAGTLTAGVTALNDNMRNAAIGAAPNFLAALRAIGVSYDDLKKMKPEERVRVLADALGKWRSPTDRGVFEAALFGTEGLDPMLRRGAAGIGELLSRARGLTGGFTDEDERRARQLAQGWAALGIAVTGVGNAVASSVAPVLVPLLNELATWISGHQQDVADFFRGIAKGLEDWSKTSGPRELLDGLKEIGREVLEITKNLLAMMQALGVSPTGAATAGIGAAILSKIPGASWLMRAAMARFPWLAAASLRGDTPGGGTGPQSPAHLQETQRRNDETNQRYGYNGNLWHDVWHWIGSGFRPGPSGRTSQDTPSATKDQFLAKWGPEARRIAAMVGTSPENILAHWAQETAWGTHEHDNNVGNLQAARPGPNTVSRGDTHADGSHYTAPFFTYANPAAAADAYADWIVRHGAVGPGLGESPAAYAERLRRAHYMENPNAPAEIARTRSEVDRVASNPHPGAPPFDPGRPSLTAPRSDPRLPDAAGPPAPLPSAGQDGSAGANGKVDMNVRIVGQPAVVTSKATGDINLNVANPGLVMGY